ncbi:MAG: phosphoadenylyl-sulfate reductase [Pseudomonadota bacterium]
MTGPRSVTVQDPALEALRAKVAEARDRLTGLAGFELLSTIIGDETVGKVALVSSFGAESVILLDMVARIDHATPIIFLNTGKLFGATLAYREALVERFELSDVRDRRPDLSDLRRHDPNGSLWSLDPDFCCHLRKTEPLDHALSGFDGWITGRKRFQGEGREALPTVEGDAATGRLKFNPLATWSETDVSEYLSERNLPVHPMVDDGYRSISCEPCTRPTKPGENARAGRWAWLDKSECGIHGEGI